MTSTESTVPTRRLDFLRLVGLAGVVGGILLIIVGVVVWVAVSSQLRAENIVNGALIVRQIPVGSSWPCGLSNSAASAGDSVSDTIAEMTVEVKVKMNRPTQR